MNVLDNDVRGERGTSPEAAGEQRRAPELPPAAGWPARGRGRLLIQAGGAPAFAALPPGAPVGAVELYDCRVPGEADPAALASADPEANPSGSLLWLPREDRPAAPAGSVELYDCRVPG